ncbi:bifunctional DNA-formamidopyrimidine glycosylase/DNA-(apurinic or apyrimidinic site) lyase [Pseudoclavibacter chungangensis]|uniref:Formamidopyrimidine-DNA glycosylase n=1 Tax=Pseudoclavibacter chungangensis TaxID=587635 RepID=A0A7J5BZ82_9MICO|nr:bifunctional DNA-formamidopyrimidine glycosylase/DNA-(apurinic or apyrimidinic site) lyase [Pseudoclavibacter chungangensis]KAB1659629.1 bifunctional DNA-formamidopyrimidine glycosylase/DNA-(apurinic or apyrimidinic site) lyase [Pseudoclavibacter chungangensis]NYJ67461.1 formamidopyrimidine-DNA glycosylase [Pseudoclavibacter chungangensis]
MPELPEVEVVRLGLEPVVTGAVVRAVEVLDERSLRRHEGSSEQFAGLLEGARLEAPRRRGKFLWVPIEGRDEALVGHLGMSGQLLFREPGAAAPRHLRVRLTLEGPNGRYDVVFVDQRVFGSLAVDVLRPAPDAPDDPAERVPGQVVHIARDPLDARFDDEAFVAALRRRRSPVKAALLDQSLVSGIGNIYADEALWRARVHFARQADGLSARTVRGLLGHVRDVFAQALVEGGTSFDAQYVNVNGQAGYFAHSLNAYGREGQPCPRCGTPLRRVPFANRSSHFCPRCQRLR